MRIPFKASEGTSFSPLPKGTYAVRIDNTKIEVAKSSGNQQVRLIMNVLEPQEYEGRTLNDWLPYTANMGWKFEQVLACFLDDSLYEKIDTGEKNDKGKPVYAFDFDTDDLVGKEGIINVDIEDDNKGGERNKIFYVRPAKKAESAPAQQAQAQAAAAPAQPAQPAQSAPASTGGAQPLERRRRMA